MANKSGDHGRRLDGRLWLFAFVLVESSPSDRLQVRFFVQKDCRARDAEGGKRALGAFLMAGVLRVVAQQCTFCINSLCHYIGGQSYSTQLACFQCDGQSSLYGSQFPGKRQLAT